MGEYVDPFKMDQLEKNLTIREIQNGMTAYDFRKTINDALSSTDSNSVQTQMNTFIGDIKEEPVIGVDDDETLNRVIRDLNKLSEDVANNRNDASDARDDAVSAQGKAEDAQQAAEDAQQAAEDAQEAAEGAQQAAEDAQQAAEGAEERTRQLVDQAPIGQPAKDYMFVQGYYYNNKFYEDVTHTQEIIGSHVLYQDIPSSGIYVNKNGAYVIVSGQVEWED